MVYISIIEPSTSTIGSSDFRSFIVVSIMLHIEKNLTTFLVYHINVPYAMY